MILHWLDLAIVGAYLLALAGIGIYFSKRPLKLEDYFLADGECRGFRWGCR